MKYKVGDKVRVINNTCLHEMPIGHETQIARIFNDDGWLVSEGWAVDEDDIELIEPINDQEDAK